MIFCALMSSTLFSRQFMCCLIMQFYCSNILLWNAICISWSMCIKIRRVFFPQHVKRFFSVLNLGMFSLSYKCAIPKKKSHITCCSYTVQQTGVLYWMYNYKTTILSTWFIVHKLILVMHKAEILFTWRSHVTRIADNCIACYQSGHQSSDGIIAS